MSSHKTWSETTKQFLHTCIYANCNWHFTWYTIHLHEDFLDNAGTESRDERISPLVQKSEPSPSGIFRILDSYNDCTQLHLHVNKCRKPVNTTYKFSHTMCNTFVYLLCPVLLCIQYMCSFSLRTLPACHAHRMRLLRF